MNNDFRGGGEICFQFTQFLHSSVAAIGASFALVLQQGNESLHAFCELNCSKFQNRPKHICKSLRNSDSFSIHPNVVHDSFGESTHWHSYSFVVKFLVFF